MSDNNSVMTVAHHELKLPPVGEKMLDISIPVVRHPGLFYAILTEEGRQKVLELTDEMTEFYNSCRTVNSRPLTPGEIVAAQWKDDKWYRARIIELSEATMQYDDDFANCIEKVRVFFVDYGEVYTTDMISVREIKSSFFKLHFQVSTYPMHGYYPCNN